MTPVDIAYLNGLLTGGVVGIIAGIVFNVTMPRVLSLWVGLLRRPHVR